MVKPLSVEARTMLEEKIKGLRMSAEQDRAYAESHRQYAVRADKAAVVHDALADELESLLK